MYIFMHMLTRFCHNLGSCLQDLVWLQSVGNHDYYPYEGYEWNEVLKTYQPGNTQWYLPWLWYNVTMYVVNYVLTLCQYIRQCNTLLGYTFRDLCRKSHDSLIYYLKQIIMLLVLTISVCLHVKIVISS